MTRPPTKTVKDFINASANENREEILLPQTPTKTAKDFIKMKKPETLAQPKVVPDAVADVFPRPLKTAAPSKANERETALFPAFARNRLSAQPKADERGTTLFPTMKRAYLFRRVAPSPPN